MRHVLDLGKGKRRGGGLVSSLASRPRNNSATGDFHTTLPATGQEVGLHGPMPDQWRNQTAPGDRLTHDRSGHTLKVALICEGWGLGRTVTQDPVVCMMRRGAFILAGKQHGSSGRIPGGRA